MTSKKSILIITRNLPPLIGGMERLNWHIADELAKNHNVTIISHTQAQSTTPQKTKFYGVPLNPLPFFLIISFLKTFWICLIQKPDILFAGSGLVAPIVVFWAKFFRKKSIVYIHGLDIGTNNKLYNLLWIPFIRHADKVITNSSPTYKICIQKKINDEKLEIIYPGVSYPPSPINIKFIKELKDQYHLHNKKILISVGRLTQRKGLNEFIDLVFSQIVKSIPNAVLIVIGDTPHQSLNKNLQSKELILSTALKHQLTKNIIFTGNISNDQILSSFYYLANIHIFPVKYLPEDPEGFGMVAIEAAAHGLPTIAFATGGIIDAVQDKETGFLIYNQSYNDLFLKIIELLENEDLIQQVDCKNYAERFSWYKLAEKFESIFEKI